MAFCVSRSEASVPQLLPPPPPTPPCCLSLSLSVRVDCIVNTFACPSCFSCDIFTTTTPLPGAPPGLINLALPLSLPQWRRYNDLENTLPTTPPPPLTLMSSIYESSLSCLRRNRVPHSLLLFHCPCLSPFFFCSALIKGGGGGFLWGIALILWYFQMQSFSAFFRSKTRTPDIFVPLQLYLIRDGGGHGLTCGHASLCCFVVQHCLLEGEESWSTNEEAEAQLVLTDLISSCGVDGKQPLVASLSSLTQFCFSYRCQCISWLWFHTHTLGTVFTTRCLWHKAKFVFDKSIMQHVYCFHCASPSCLVHGEQDQKHKLDPPDWTAKSRINKDFFFPLKLGDHSCRSSAACMHNFLFYHFGCHLKKKKKESHSPGAHMPCIQPHWSSLEQVPHPPLQRSRHETAADYGWMRPTVGS